MSQPAIPTGPLRSVAARLTPDGLRVAYHEGDDACASSDERALTLFLAQPSQGTFALAGDQASITAWLRADAKAANGSITLTDFTPGARVVGSFSARFPQGSLDGTFDVAFCGSALCR